MESGCTAQAVAAASSWDDAAEPFPGNQQQLHYWSGRNNRWLDLRSHSLPFSKEDGEDCIFLEIAIWSTYGMM